MFKIKLTALEHPTPDNLNFNDRTTFANTILWLEDQKIRFYRIEDRAGLRKVDNIAQWEKAYAKYKSDMEIPNFDTSIEEMSWFLDQAIQLEYFDAPEQYRDINSEEIQKKDGMSKSSESSSYSQHPFSTLDLQHKEFIDGVRELARKLNIAHHPDHLIQLEACRQVFEECLSAEAAKKPKVKGMPFPFEKGAHALCNDPQLVYPFQILRLLQIQRLRKLQTKINEVIVAVQEVTADPKTDTKLGKVGF